ncbi:cag pathogenicity island protein Cag25 [Pseudoalteromonas porphyrae]|uniref:Cag pathogenicity island protein Cag25 n=1 Tax=Pseudoalteromonas porphyrae TaxID=187330 RepID=A0A0N1MSX6_9GAMM|nr:cag pathogenicity island protein Cag25 [Pseudoalteromonas porphyrae]KPH61932.1 cag pathogenicity island protein Cag25 [Pseudoalteromonas porphyrae]
MKQLTVLCVCISTFLSSAAFAMDAKITFSELDKDGNGSLSSAEASEDALLHESFEQIDKDQDGQISLAEFKLFLQ